MAKQTPEEAEAKARAKAEAEANAERLGALLEELATRLASMPKGRYFKPADINPDIVRELAKYMSWQKIQERLHFRGTNKALTDAFDIGRAEGVQHVSSRLYDLAMAGNTAAAIFFLKNRAPKDWQDNRQIDMSAEVVQKSPMEQKSTADLLKIIKLGTCDE